jgi:hypothetical protein
LNLKNGLEQRKKWKNKSLYEFWDDMIKTIHLCIHVTGGVKQHGCHTKSKISQINEQQHTTKLEQRQRNITFNLSAW